MIAFPEIPGWIRPDTPIRLKLAARIAFPGGAITEASLRRERDAGRLQTEIIAGKEFTTLNAIGEMRRKCRVQPKARASTGERKAAARTAACDPRQDGSSAMETASSPHEASRAVAAARLAAQQLKRR